MSLRVKSTITAILLGCCLLPRAEAQNIPLPAAYWSFDNCSSGTVMDDSGNGNPLTLSGGASCAAGQYGTAGSFDGVDDRADSPNTNSPALKFTTQVTVTAWVKPTTTSGLYTIVNKWYQPDSYGLFINYGQYVFTVALANGTWVNAQAPATAGVWSHVAGVYDGATVKIYVNGALRQTVAAPGSLKDSGRPVVVGNHPAWNAYKGLIDEVRLYRAALNSVQIAGMAATPSGVSVRGLHLFPSQWVPDSNPNAPDQIKYAKDLSRIQHIANLNSVKSLVVTAGENPDGLARQRSRLTQLKAAAGNHVTWVFRAWPMTPANGAGYVDLVPGSNYYEQGRQFARKLADPFFHIKFNLKLQNVLIEVANEPNIVEEGFTNSAAYNDFFRGFYFGQQEVGYNFPLVYAGLSPAFNPDTWYSDGSVRAHIQSYAAKVGAHIYWTAGQRTSLTQGRHYRRIHDLLAAGGVTPRGIVITEFNGVRPTFPDAEAQAADFCQWWREEQADAQSGWWVEQAQLYVTDSNDGNDQTNYVVLDNQIDNIRDCR